VALPAETVELSVGAPVAALAGVSITIAPVPHAAAPFDPRLKLEQRTKQDDDAALAAALLAREPGAAAHAWTQLSPLVLGFLRRYFGPRADHEDLCQEVFVRFFSRIAELRVPQALRGFLLGICLGVAQNERRRANVRRAIALTPTGDLPDHACPDTDLEAREALARLQHILMQAAVEDRTLFVSRFIEDSPLSDIARDTGRPIGTVKRRVASARRRFASKMRRDPALAAYVEGSTLHPMRARLARAA
jgi:RNA polymerase sigma-70 factor (ECF subfamily)